MGTPNTLPSDMRCLVKNIDRALQTANAHLAQGTVSHSEILSMLELKTSLSHINALVTKFSEIAFINFLKAQGLIDDACAKATRDRQMNASAFSNGYDVVIEQPRIIAEVKSLCPVKGNEFGSAQKNAILRDIKGLLDPGIKKREQVNNPDQYVKFMALLQTADRADFDNAVDHILSIARKKGYRTELYTAPLTQFRLDTVYLVSVTI